MAPLLDRRSCPPPGHLRPSPGDKGRVFRPQHLEPLEPADPLPQLLHAFPALPTPAREPRFLLRRSRDDLRVRGEPAQVPDYGRLVVPRRPLRQLGPHHPLLGPNRPEHHGAGLLGHRRRAPRLRDVHPHHLDVTGNIAGLRPPGIVEREPDCLHSYADTGRRHARHDHGHGPHDRDIHRRRGIGDEWDRSLRGICDEPAHPFHLR